MIASVGLAVAYQSFSDEQLTARRKKSAKTKRAAPKVDATAAVAPTPASPQGSKSKSATSKSSRKPPLKPSPVHLPSSGAVSGASSPATNAAQSGAAALSDGDLFALVMRSLKSMQTHYHAEGALEKRTLQVLRAFHPSVATAGPAIAMGGGTSPVASASTTTTPTTRSPPTMSGRTTPLSHGASLLSAAGGTPTAAADASLGSLGAPVPHYSASGSAATPSAGVLLLPQSTASVGAPPAAAVPASGSSAVPLLRAAVSMKPYRTETRIAAAQWLLLHHTLASLALDALIATATTPAALGAARQQKHALAADLELAWRFLKLPTAAFATRAAAIGVVEAARLDIASRLRQAKRMAHTLNGWLAHARNTAASANAGAGAGAAATTTATGAKSSFALNPHSEWELGVAFVAACQLGRWPIAAQLGCALSPAAMAEYHLAASEQPVTDFTVVHRLANARLPAAAAAAAAHEHPYGLGVDLPASGLRWCTYAVRRLLIRVRHVQCTDVRVVSSIQSQYSPLSGAEWKSIELDARYPHRLTRTGAVVHMISLSSCPIPMAGTITHAGALTIHGFADVSPQQPVHQTELYRLTRDTAAEHLPLPPAPASPPLHSTSFALLSTLNGSTAGVATTAAGAPVPPVTLPPSAATPTSSLSSHFSAASTSTAVPPPPTAASLGLLVYSGSYEFTHEPITAADPALLPPTASATTSGPAKPVAAEPEDLKVYFDVQLTLEELPHSAL